MQHCEAQSKCKCISAAESMENFEGLLAFKDYVTRRKQAIQQQKEAVLHPESQQLNSNNNANSDEKQKRNNMKEGQSFKLNESDIDMMRKGAINPDTTISSALAKLDDTGYAPTESQNKSFRGLTQKEPTPTLQQFLKEAEEMKNANEEVFTLYPGNHIPSMSFGGWKGGKPLKHISQQLEIPMSRADQIHHASSGFSKMRLATKKFLEDGRKKSSQSLKDGGGGSSRRSHLQEIVEELQQKQSSSTAQQKFINMSKSKQMQSFGKKNNGTDEKNTVTSFRTATGQPQNNFADFEETSVNMEQQITKGQEDHEIVEDLDDITEEMINSIIGDLKYDEVNQFWFHFLAFLIQDSFSKFPDSQSINLKIASAFLQSKMLKNDFKAVFELLTCDRNQELSLQQQFTIFSMKIMIEQEMIVSQNRINHDRGMIDVKEVFTYEKFFQRYSLLEYLTANSALMFWRELLSNSADERQMQRRGNKISRNYAKMQDLCRKMNQIYPNDLKFLYRYGLFLKEIINNKYEALSKFKEVYQVYYTKLSKQQQEGNAGSQDSEVQSFGENSASAVIIINANSHEIGTILHANEETRHLLGFAPKDLIGRNVSMIMSSNLGEVHSQFIQRYLETAQSHALNFVLQKFALNKEGYLKSVKLLLKVYPRLNDQIVFVGMLHSNENFSDLEPPKSSFDRQPQHYIITDSLSGIVAVSEGLNYEIGFNSKCFLNSQQLAHKITLASMSPEITEANCELNLENDGEILAFNTSDLLDNIELERLSSEEVLQVRSKLGIFHAYVQLKKYHHPLANSTLQVNVYRVIILPEEMFSPDNNDIEWKLNSESSLAKEEFTAALHSKEGGQANHEQIDHLLHSGGSESDEMHVSSVSSLSSTSSENSFTKMIKDFKQALSVRNTPQKLVYLDRMIMIIVLISIGFTCIEYALKMGVMSGISLEGRHSLATSNRNMRLILLASNTRTMINVANNLEDGSYEGDLSEINRFSYLSELNQKHHGDLMEVQNFCTQQRFVDGEMDDQAIFEYQPISVHTLDKNGSIHTYQQPFRVAFNQYMANILVLNKTTENDQQLPGYILQGSPLVHVFVKNQNPSPIELASSFILLNGLREVRTKTTEANELQINIAYENTQDQVFLILMVSGITVCIISICIVLSQIWIIEKNKQDILSLYTQLNLDQIKRVYDKCDLFLNILYQEGGMGTNFYQQNKMNASQVPKDAVALPDHSDIAVSFIKAIDAGPQMKKVSTDAAGNRQNQELDIDNDQMSEEEKEEQLIKNICNIHKSQRHKIQSTMKNGRPIGSQFDKNRKMLDQRRTIGNDSGVPEIRSFAELIIQQTVKQIKEIAEDERRAEFPSSIINTQLGLKRLHHKESSNISDEHEKNGQVKPEREQRKRLKDFGLKLTKPGRRHSSNKSGFKTPFQKKTTQHHGEHAHHAGAESHRVHKQDEDSDSNEEKEGKDSENNSSVDSSRAAIMEHEMHTELHESQHHHHHKRKREKERGNITKNQNLKGQGSQVYSLSQRNTSWRFFIVNSIVGLVISLYFVYSYWFHLSEVYDLKLLKNNAPIFFNRYIDLMLGYALMRERIINNNSLDSFILNTTIFNSADQDELYRKRSLENEKQIAHLKTQNPKVLQSLLDYATQIDTEHFCQYIISDLLDSESSTKLVLNNKIKTKRRNAYQLEIDTVIAAIMAAAKGNVEKLKQLHESGVDLSKGDYDRKTPLHVACQSGQLNTAKYLIDIGVNVNAIDRWGGTPLNYVTNNAYIRKFLIEKNAIEGPPQPIIKRNEVTLLDDQYRLYYAAINGDISLMTAWLEFKWDINIVDQVGRSALMMASSEGKLETVKFLINVGADISLKDMRDDDILDCARQENRTQTFKYLSGIINDSLIKHYCHEYGGGILDKGIAQAMGTFHKKFSDLQIIVNATISYQELLQLLGHNVSQSSLFKDQLRSSNTSQISPFVNDATQKIISTFLQVQELYFNHIIEDLVSVIRQAQQNFIKGYTTTTQVVFIVFLIFQLSILFILRIKLISMMREDVFQSRGILNLIPEEFFEQNRDAVEKIIKKLKD